MTDMWWHVALAVAGSLLLIWVALVAVVYVVGRETSEPTTMTEALRLLPDILRLVRRLAADPTLPRGVRIRLFLLTGYLICPVDLVPDFLPVIGYADDAIIVAWGLRSVVRVAGVEVLDRHWPGTPAGLAVLKRLALART